MVNNTTTLPTFFNRNYITLFSYLISFMRPRYENNNDLLRSIHIFTQNSVYEIQNFNNTESLTKFEKKFERSIDEFINIEDEYFYNCRIKYLFKMMTDDYKYFKKIKIQSSSSFNKNSSNKNSSNKNSSNKNSSNKNSSNNKDSNKNYQPLFKNEVKAEFNDINDFDRLINFSTIVPDFALPFKIKNYEQKKCLFNNDYDENTALLDETLFNINDNNNTNINNIPLFNNNDYNGNDNNNNNFNNKTLINDLEITKTINPNLFIILTISIGIFGFISFFFLICYFNNKIRRERKTKKVLIKI